MTADSAQVHGFVVDAQSGVGLAALAVQLSSEGELVTVATTDAAGSFQFDGLVAGTYVVAVASGESAPLTLSIGEVESNLVLDVEPAAAAVASTLATN